MFDQFNKLDELGKKLTDFMDKVNSDLEQIKKDQAEILNYLRNTEGNKND